VNDSALSATVVVNLSALRTIVDETAPEPNAVVDEIKGLELIEAPATIDAAFVLRVSDLDDTLLEEIFYPEYGQAADDHALYVEVYGDECDVNLIEVATHTNFLHWPAPRPGMWRITTAAGYVEQFATRAAARHWKAGYELRRPDQKVKIVQVPK
jgi:hypothetical protein